MQQNEITIIFNFYNHLDNCLTQCFASISESDVLVGSCLAFGLFVRGGLACVVLPGLTGRSTGARLCDGFIFQLPGPRPVSSTLGVRGYPDI
jgi:hypothetical protein